MEEVACFRPLHGRANQERRHLRTQVLGLTLFFLVFELVALEARGAVVEDEISVRHEAFSIPDEVAKEKRRAARKSGFSLLKAAGVTWGVDDNIYRSPSGLEESGNFWGGWAYLRADKRFDEEQRLMTTLSWLQVRYPGNSNANSDRAHISTWYTRPLTDNTAVEFDLDIDYRNDDATNIRGERYERDYSYWRYTTEGLFIWNMSREHRFEIGGGYRFKNYDETPGDNSLDWTEPFFKVLYRYRFGSSHYLGLVYSLKKREYEEEPASLRDGTEPSSNPKEKHRYQRAGVWYSVPLSEKVDLGLKYYYRTKEDLFKNYESYNSHRIEAGIDLEVSEKMDISMNAGYTIRNYDNILGDNGHKLEYTKWDLRVGARYKLRDSCWIFGNLSYYDRQTNKSFGNLYRDYKGLVCSTGLGFFF